MCCRSTTRRLVLSALLFVSGVAAGADFEMMMIEASTMAPIATAMPPSDMMLRSMSDMYIGAKVAITLIGIELSAQLAAMRLPQADMLWNRVLGRRQDAVEPDEVAAMVLFLLSPRAGHITGQSLIVDGGETRAL